MDEVTNLRGDGREQHLRLNADLGQGAARRRVVFACPSLPSFLEEVRLQNLRVGDGTVDLVLQRYARSVGVEVLRRQGNIEVVTVK